MHANIIVLLVAILVAGIQCQTPAGTNTSLTQISQVPPCFTACANKAAVSLHCKGVEDVTCTCANPMFANATMGCINTSGDNDCPTVKSNVTALQQGNQLLSYICKQASPSNTAATNASQGSSQPASNVPAHAKDGGSSTLRPVQKYVTMAAVILSTSALAVLALL